MNTLTVKGEVTLSVAPDITVFNLDINERNKSYDKLVVSSEKILKKLNSIISGCGLDEKNLKTVNMEVYPEFRSEHRDDTYRNVFECYVYNQSLQIEFGIDNDLLSGLISEITSSGINVSFQVSFSVRDTEKYKDMLISKAVKEAGRKAEIIAREASVFLKGISDIRYNITDMSFRNESMRFNTLAKGASFDSAMAFDVNPEDVTLSDNIEITWEICEYRKNMV